MKKFIQNANKHRIASASVGLLVMNFIIAIIVDQFGVAAIHPNVIATGTLLGAAVVNKLVAKIF